MLYTIQSIAPVIHKLRATGKTIVLATGFFDLLHSEHINFLHKARTSGDVLIVAVESDARAKQLKGEGRPIESQATRCQHLLSLTTPGVVSDRIETPGVTQCVDYVINLPDDFNNLLAYDSLMQTIKPDIYAVSSHTTHLQSKTSLVQKYGGKLQIVHDFNPNISTTQIINSQNQV